MTYVVILVPLLAGMLLAWQGAMNAALARSVSGPEAAGIYSLFFSAILVLGITLAARQPIGLAGWSNAPWWALLGGVAGAVVVMGGIYVVPITGAAVFIGGVVLGQATGAATADHFGWFGLPERPMDLGRGVGLLLILGGLYLVRR
ncbi:MAG: DMT family transporter [Pseudomonadota bacterium]